MGIGACGRGVSSAIAFLRHFRARLHLCLERREFDAFLLHLFCAARSQCSASVKGSDLIRSVGPRLFLRFSYKALLAVRSSSARANAVSTP